MRVFIIILLFLMVALAGKAQQKFEFDGQLSTYGSYGPDNPLSGFVGGRYLPRVSYKIPLDTLHRMIDFEASANIYGSLSFHPFDSSYAVGDVQAYRLWARYSGKQFEARLGLQKIDFGSATILRPLQWFNQIDPRDPLRLTNGVYGGLGRYYFINNANIWIWALYGNENTRGFEAIPSDPKIPEYGGRIQYPVPKGEIALSYHHRTADATNIIDSPQYKEIPENRIGVDGKWDVGVGLWFEGAYIKKEKMIGELTNQTFLSLGIDYTFGIGSGLNVVVEHLFAGYNESNLSLANSNNTDAITLTYPRTLFDTISLIGAYSWSTESATVFLNYQHDFKKVTGYLMAYYNPTVKINIQQNEFVNQFAGPGIRLMFVYNH